MERTESQADRVAWSGAWPLFRRFWPYLRPERRLTAAIGILMLLAIPSGVVSPLIVRHIFDVVLVEEDVRTLVLSGAALVGLTLLLYGLRYAQALLSITLRNRVRYRVTRDVFDHALRLPLAFFDRTETGELMSRVRDDVGGLDGIMSDTLVGGVVDVLRALLFLALLLVRDPGLALAGFALVSVLFAGIFIVSRRLRRLSARAREADASSSAALLEALSGLVTVRTTAQEPRERTRFMTTVQSSIRAAARRDVLGRATGTAFGLVGVLGAYVIIAVGAYRILLGHSTFGGLFAFFIFLTQLMGSAGGVSGLVPAIQRSLASLQRIWAVLDETPEVEAAGLTPTRPRRPRAAGLAPASPRRPDSVDRALPTDLRGDVRLEGITFDYEDGTRALSDVSLDVRAGEVIALVGRSGAGKSTLVQLLPRLYEPSLGRVLLDDRPLGHYPLTWLRRRIGVVPQDVFLFNRSVRDNIAYATPDADDGRILTACVDAHADEFIARLVDGLDTVVGERGVRLSGGEKQRLAIAREFLRDPPLLILDEATSNLDAESEEMVRDAVQRLMAGRTCFVIAHRLSTVRIADRIVVLDAGRIVELGRHDELLTRDGLFAELHRRQELAGASSEP